MKIQKPYVPIIKKRGFEPNPVAGNIPLYADGRSNPKVIGTSAYEEFWEEQIDRCINGYNTGGLNIPGPYYYFLNFRILYGVKGPMYPMYVDLDYQIHDLDRYVKKHKKTGMIIPKARRRGLSEYASNKLSHGLRFIPGYKGAVAAGLERYQKELKRKLENAESRVIGEFKLNVLENNDKTYRTGYKIKDPIVGFIEDGFGGYISFETMYDKAEKLEGEYFHDVIFEESGQFPLLGETFESIKPALMFGSEMIGSFYIYGTGGNILSSSAGFKEFWDNADTFGLEKFWIPGTRKHYPFFSCDTTENEEVYEPIDEEDATDKELENRRAIDPIPNLRHLKPYQRIGCEDIKASEQWIIQKRKEYAKLKNKKRLKKHNQSYPLTVEEAFTSSGSNDFDDEKIIERLFQIEGEDDIYTGYVLDWKYEKNKDGVLERVTPMEVEARLANNNDNIGKIVWVYQKPLKGYKDLDLGGIDSYNQDKSQTGNSLGSMVVFRQGSMINLESKGVHNGDYPVCLYYNRPARKETFYEICLKIAVWYDLRKNVMASAEQDFVIGHFERNGGKKYLSPRPRSFDAPKSEQTHNYGAKFTSYSKPRILGLVQSWVLDYVQFCNFPPLLRDLLAYDEEYIGTDWDSVDALAYAIMRQQDMKSKPRKSSEYDSDGDSEAIWAYDNNGNPYIKNENKLITNKAPKNTEQIDSKENWRKGYSYSDEPDEFKGLL